MTQLGHISRWKFLRPHALAVRLAGLLFVVLMSRFAPASIWQPEFDDICFQAISADGGATSAMAAPASTPNHDEGENEQNQRVTDDPFMLPDATGGASSTSSSPSGGGGASIPLIGGDARCRIESTLCAGWVTGDFSLKLPMPPGTELLRPPQTA